MTISKLKESLIQLKPYILLSTTLLFLGFLIGTILEVTGFNLAQALGAEAIEDLYPDEISFLTILSNNTIALFGIALGGVTIGLYTALGLIMNGVLIGYIVPEHAISEGLLPTFLLLVPHGIIEIPAILIGAAIGLRIAHLIFNRVIKKTRIDKEELKKLSTVFTFCLTLIVIAAFLETYLTFWIAEKFIW